MRRDPDRQELLWNDLSRSHGDALPDLAFDPSSQFAMLLVDTAPTGALRGKAWLAVARADVRLAMHTLRFAAGDGTFGAEASRDEAVQFLGDIKETIATLSVAHFEPIAGLLHAETAGEPVGVLGI